MMKLSFLSVPSVVKLLIHQPEQENYNALSL